MVAYAQGTTVPVAKSKMEIEQLLTKRKARNFASGHNDGHALIAFELNNRRILLTFPLPDREGPEFKMTTRYGKEARLTPDQSEKAWDAECRRRWRAMVLIVKAKLEAVASGISTLENEFLANIVVPGGKTFGEWAAPHLQAAYDKGVNMPPLLGG
jgi:hypothetical protein